MLTQPPEKMSNRNAKFRSERGATKLEYVLIGVLISLVALLSLTSLGGSISQTLSITASAIGGGGTYTTSGDNGGQEGDEDPPYDPDAPDPDIGPPDDGGDDEDGGGGGK